jgi:hypothetical protein
MSLVVQFAVYGALDGGDSNKALAADVKARLQQLIETDGGVVPINNASFSDPDYGNVKHFGACVVRDGVPHYFACQEGQTINFNVAGGTN